ncbi:hypothetical protein B0H11DRAFT_2048890 [Mycena galericulata]|nr:hypothetical protein B0H11DRAFT_2048890 [Mycena galericulata]
MGRFPSKRFADAAAFSQRIADAMRIPRRTHTLPHPSVYVGNLDEGVTETQLRRHFCVYGKVNNVEIGYSSGLRPELGFSYAIVEFRSRRESYAALLRDGSRLLGRRSRLAVRGFIVHLPEVERQRRHFAKTVAHGNSVGKGQLPDSLRTGTSGLRSVCVSEKLELTEVWTSSADSSEASSDEQSGSNESIGPKRMILWGVPYTLATA